MRTNIILIDSENVKPESIEKLKGEHFQVVVFIGKNQKRIGSDLVMAVQGLGSRGRFIKISGNGPNALDFHIAYYIGTSSAADPSACFHIISRDKGFDPLIKHLADQKIICSRSPSISEITRLKTSKNVQPNERAANFYEKRIARSKARPARVNTLQRTILSHFPTLSSQEVSKVIEALKDAGHVVVNGKKVEYPKRA